MKPQSKLMNTTIENRHEAIAEAQWELIKSATDSVVDATRDEIKASLSETNSTMNQQAFTNALHAITGEPRNYPEHPAPDPVKVALAALEEFEATLQAMRMLPHDGHTTTEWQARIEMRVNELRELITTGELLP